MLRLAPLQWQPPQNLAHALQLLAQPGARALAGGSDLLPNLKLASTRAKILVPIGDLSELSGIELADDGLRIGAACGLSELGGDVDIQEHFPALAFAVGRIASPQIRNMGTIGGNLALDTRCRYINQSELWREALGGCLKSHGQECHVVPGGQGCVAALSADSVPVLIAYHAVAHLARWDGAAVVKRSIALADLYGSDGLRHFDLQPGELLTHLQLPLPQANAQVVYRKWAVRQSIDFPLVSVAVRLERAADGCLANGLVVVGALGPRPRLLPLTKLAGAAVDRALAKQVGDLAFDRCRPLPNLPYDADYRRERLRIEVRRAVVALSAP